MGDVEFGAVKTGAPTVLVAPRPKSPPKYPDLCGKRRLELQVQILNREIGFLEQDELQSLEGLQPVSKFCKDVNDFVRTKSDPLVPIDFVDKNVESHKSNCLSNWLSCFKFGKTSCCRPCPSGTCCGCQCTCLICHCCAGDCCPSDCRCTKSCCNCCSCLWCNFSESVCAKACCNCKHCCECCGSSSCSCGGISNCCCGCTSNFGCSCSVVPCFGCSDVCCCRTKCNCLDALCCNSKSSCLDSCRCRPCCSSSVLSCFRTSKPSCWRVFCMEPCCCDWRASCCSGNCCVPLKLSCPEYSCGCIFSCPSRS